VFNWSDEESTGAEGVVDDQWDTSIVGDLGDSLNIWHVVSWVTNGLDVDSLGLLVNGSGDILWLVTSNELGIDAKTWKEDLELVVGSSVDVGCGNNVVTSLREGCNGHELSRLTGGCGNSGDTTFKSCYPLLENIDSWLVRQSSQYGCPYHSCGGGKARLPGKILGGLMTYVHDTRVDVAKLLETEETSSMGGVIEDVGCGGIDGDGTGIGC
jgi:hypothetical protein